MISSFVFITNSNLSNGQSIQLISRWNVAGALVSSKGITIYSYRPNLVGNAVNFSCPSTIVIKWKAAFISILVIKSALLNFLDNSSIIGNGVLSCFVWSVGCLESTHNLNRFPFGLGTNRIELPTELLDGRIVFSLIIFSRYSTRIFSSSCDNWWIGPILSVSTVVINSILWSQPWLSGNFSACSWSKSNIYIW